MLRVTGMYGLIKVPTTMALLACDISVIANKFNNMNSPVHQSVLRDENNRQVHYDHGQGNEE